MLKQLFLDGFSFENYQSIASQEEKDLIKEVQKNIKFSNEIIEKIKKVEEDIFIVASVETWCPYARVFSTTMNEVTKINNNFKISFITMGRGLNDIAGVLKINDEDYVVPTAIILDKNYELKASFIGFPEFYRENGFKKKEGATKGERLSYFDGERTELIINDILEKLNLI